MNTRKFPWDFTDRAGITINPGWFTCLLGVVVVLLPVILSTWYIAENRETAFESEVRRGLEREVRFVAEALNNVIESDVRTLKLSVSYPEVIGFMEPVVRSEILLLPLWERCGFDDVFLVDTSGDIVFSTMSSDKNTEFIKTAATGVLKTSESLIIDGYDPEIKGSSQYYLLSSPIKKEGAVIGAVIVRRFFSYVFGQIDIPGIQQTGVEHYLIGKDRLLRGGIYRTDTRIDESKPRIPPGTSMPPEGKSEFFERTGIHGTATIGIASSLIVPVFRGPEWFLISELTEGVYRPGNDTLVKSAVASLVTTVLFTCLFIFFFYRWFIIPVSELKRWATDASSGHIRMVSPTKRRDDLGQIVNGISGLTFHLRDLEHVCRSIASGDFSGSCKAIGDNDILSDTVNGIINYLDYMTDKVREIARGNYSVSIEPASEKDRLGPELTRMAEALHQMNQENFRQISTTFAQMELMRRISGEHELTSITEELLSFLSHYFNSQIGVFYIKEPESQLLNIYGSFGCIREALPEKVEPGEGLVGQALVEKKHFLINKCPDDYFSIVSGLGSDTPTHLLVYPFLFKNEVIAVMEIGSLNILGSDHIGFLSKNNESISIALNSAIGRTRMAELLKQTLEQSAILETQQKELKRANTDLASQTDALIKSEYRLRVQEEELRVANKDLELYSQNLEKQKEILDMNNKALEEAKSSLENKALELELSNLYKSEFLANMSHELRTPLNSIILLSNLLSENRDGRLGAKQQEFVEIINNSGNELLHHINEILELSRMTTGKMEVNTGPVVLGEIINKIDRLYRPEAEDSGLAFSIDIDKEIPNTIQTDLQKLNQILKNFLSNAFKFTDSGNVALVVRRPEKGVDLSRSGLQPDSAVEFTVTDTGKGIPDEKQQLIFEAFKQADGGLARRHGGTGVGLSISQEFAHLLGGEIQLISEPDKGSSFSLYIPDTLSNASPEAEDTQANEIVIQSFSGIPEDAGKVTLRQTDTVTLPDKAGAEAERPDLKVSGDLVADPVFPGKTVLLADPDIRHVFSLTGTLESAGMKVLRTVTGDDVIRVIEDESGKVDIVLLDTELSGMSGYEVLKSIRKKQELKDLPVIAVSADCKKDSGEKAAASGANACITKPASHESILSTMKQYLS